MIRIRILALDTATNCGWASWLPRGGMESGAQSFKPGRGESPGMRFLRFRKWLSDMITRIKPSVIAYERSGHFKGVAAAEVCHGFQTIMHEEATSRKVDTAPVQNSALKKHATGKGNAGKPEMIKAASKRWGLPLGKKEHDRADALCVLAWALEEFGVESRPLIVVKRIRG